MRLPSDRSAGRIFRLASPIALLLRLYFLRPLSPFRLIGLSTVPLLPLTFLSYVVDCCSCWSFVSIGLSLFTCFTFTCVTISVTASKFVCNWPMPFVCRPQNFVVLVGKQINGLYCLICPLAISSLPHTLAIPLSSLIFLPCFLLKSALILALFRSFGGRRPEPSLFSHFGFLFVLLRHRSSVVHLLFSHFGGFPDSNESHFKLKMLH